MGIGISEAAALLWKAYDPESYNALFQEQADGYYWFDELPDWAYSEDVGPFYIADNGAIYTANLRPSQNGIMIGNLV